MEIVFNWSRHFWIHIVVLFLSGFSAYLCWKYFFDLYYIYSKFQERYIKPYYPVIHVDTLATAMDLIKRKNENFKNEIEQKTKMQRVTDQQLAASIVVTENYCIILFNLQLHISKKKSRRNTEKENEIPNIIESSKKLDK